jgi:proteasome lid subunit RPN8/RPN11
VWTSLTAVLRAAQVHDHEGVTYFVGQTDGARTSVLASVCVRSHSTAGSFYVPADQMLRVVNAASHFGLQVVGQLHTHPFEAFHSVGDEIGAQIKYDGYVSIVVPRYGHGLPSLVGVKTFMFDGARQAFVEISNPALLEAVL